MDVFTLYATDETLEVEGAWHKGSGNAEFLIARAANRKYQRALAKAAEDNEELLTAKNDAADIRTNEVMAEVFADTILRGWKNVEYKKAPLEYTRDNAVMLLKHTEFRKFIAKKSEDLDKYRAKLEVEQGNA